MSRLRAVVPVLPLLLALLALVLLDASDQITPPPTTVVEKVAPTRLLVLMVDSLDRRDVDRLPRLCTRLADASTHGPVIACVDGVTIPCVSAMITGFDRVSGFSPLRNFGAARGLTQRSVLGALVARGVRVGYFGDPLLARALAGLTRIEAHEVIDDEASLRQGLAALATRDLDLAFVHLLELDEAAHKFTEQDVAYPQTLERLDARIADALDARPPDAHLVVLGDHGHIETGRHGAGLGTETYAAYFGPRFAGGPRRMAMTDHARVWARLFGLRWGDSVPAAATLAVRPRSLLPLLGVLLCALATAVATNDPRLRGDRRGIARARALLLAAGAILALSVIVPRLWATLGSELGALGLALVLGLAGVGFGRIALGATPRSAKAGETALPLAGALLLALPSAEPTSGLKSPVLWLIAALAALSVHAARSRAWKTALRASLGVAACAALALVRVRAYLPRVLLEHEVGAWLGVAVPALLMVAAVRVAAGRRPAVVVALGALVARGLPVEARWLILPCALILLLTFAAFRRAWSFELACLLLPIACAAFFPDDSAQLAAVATTWLLWAIVPALLREEPVLLRASACMVLFWLSFWTAMSTRVGGIDYDFYFRWLPSGAAATSEAVQQGLLTAIKCILPAAFGALLAHRADAFPIDVLKTAEHLTRLRLALTLVFVAGLSIGRGAVDVHLLYDATQEVGFWMLAFASLGLVAAAMQVGASDEVVSRGESMR